MFFKKVCMYPDQLQSLTEYIESFKDNSVTIDSVNVLDDDGYTEVTLCCLSYIAYVDRLYSFLYDMKAVEVE